MNLTAQKVLELCEIKDNVVRLPNTQLDRKLYMEVKKLIGGIDGKWNRSKKGFVIPPENIYLFEQLQKGEKRNLKKEYQFFETPKEIAQKIVELADISEGHLVLEPSAGKGAILREIPTNCDIVACEIMLSNQNYIEEHFPHVEFWVGDFLNTNNRHKFDRIVANPPFSKNQDIKHVTKMYNMLAPGGRLVSVMSIHFTFAEDKESVAFRNLLGEVRRHEFFELGLGAFKSSGTMVNTIIVVIDK